MPFDTACVEVDVVSGKDVPVVLNWNIKPTFALVGMAKILLITSVPLAIFGCAAFTPAVKKPPWVSPANAVVPLRLMKSIRLVEFAIDMNFAVAVVAPVVGLMNDFTVVPAPVVTVNRLAGLSYTMNTWTPDGSVPFAPLRLENPLKS